MIVTFQIVTRIWNVTSDGSHSSMLSKSKVINLKSKGSITPNVERRDFH